MTKPLVDVHTYQKTCPGCGLSLHITVESQLVPDIEIIRAFVGRVENLKGQSGEGRFGYRQRVYAELAAMERQENNS